MVAGSKIQSCFTSDQYQNVKYDNHAASGTLAEETRKARSRSDWLTLPAPPTPASFCSKSNIGMHGQNSSEK